MWSAMVQSGWTACISRTICQSVKREWPLTGSVSLGLLTGRRASRTARRVHRTKIRPGRPVHLRRGSNLHGTSGAAQQAIGRPPVLLAELRTVPCRRPATERHSAATRLKSHLDDVDDAGDPICGRMNASVPYLPEDLSEGAGTWRLLFAPVPRRGGPRLAGRPTPSACRTLAGNQPTPLCQVDG